LETKEEEIINQVQTRQYKDEYLLSYFKKMCPDAAKYLNSWNPFARKSAESILWGFTIGFILRNDFSDDEVLEWETAVINDICTKCEYRDNCSLDPFDCKIVLEAA